MAEMVNVNFKLDAETKKAMEKACAEMGLSMSAAFTVYAKKIAREMRIPFEINVDPFYSESNINYLRHIIKDVNEGKARFEKHDLIAED